MDDPVYQRLLELSWRRKLTDSETAELQAWLAANPAAREQWESEAGLEQLLEQLPAPPTVSTNFTAQVLAAVGREAAADARARRRGWRFRQLGGGWLPRAAAASLVLALGLVSWHAVKVHARRAMARSVVQLSPLVASHPDLLQNFDAIHRLSDQPKPDTELLTLMQ